MMRVVSVMMSVYRGGGGGDDDGRAHRHVGRLGVRVWNDVRRRVWQLVVHDQLLLVMLLLLQEEVLVVRRLGGVVELLQRGHLLEVVAAVPVRKGDGLHGHGRRGLCLRVGRQKRWRRDGGGGPGCRNIQVLCGGWLWADLRLLPFMLLALLNELVVVRVVEADVVKLVRTQLMARGGSGDVRAWHVDVSLRHGHGGRRRNHAGRSMHVHVYMWVWRRRQVLLMLRLRWLPSTLLLLLLVVHWYR